MNRRQFKKLSCSLVAKVVAKSIQPSLNLKATRPEKKLFRVKQPFIKSLVVATVRELND